LEHKLAHDRAIEGGVFAPREIPAMGLIPVEQIAAKGFESAGREGGWIQKGGAVERGEAVISFNRKERVRMEMVRSKIVPRKR